MDLSEKETREKVINPQLKSVGWTKEYIKEEVNSVKSNFKKRDYTLADKNSDVEKGVDRFIDYLLLDSSDQPLAIIEAKKTSVSEEKGRIQARTYRQDVEKQTGEKLPVFLTNGDKWIFIDQDGVERKVAKPFSQVDLKRRSEMYKTKRNPIEIKIERIVDRPKSILIVKQLAEHFSKGHRSALICMATGTGKTRVAMGIIDLLIKANYVRNVLFVVDRIELSNQAKSAGFKQFFSEPVADLRNGFNTTSRLYVSTVQTLMSGGKKKMFEKFNPAFFDLIIFDEAHRSFYDRNNMINEYFDAIRIGLTATPSNSESRNTFKLFDCEQGKPTVEYPYDEAIRDEVLVPYKAEMIETKVLSLGIEGAKLTADLKDQLRKQEEDPEYIMLPGSKFDRVFMDDKTNELVVREFMGRCYKSDESKPCKTIFFCASIRHAKLLKRIFNKLYPNLSNDVQIIVSEFYRYTDEIGRFKLDSEPRVALSVGVLDSGVDIPEVCNLVFVKPVFSSIRFWQMLGRGTRNIKACQHKEWLPNREKKDFLILDFTIGGHSNIEYHHLKASKEREKGKDAITKIFLARVELLNKKMSDKQRKLVEDKILGDIESLDQESFMVREKLSIIKKLVSRKFELKNYVSELKNEIAPLMILNPGQNPLVTAFILKVEKLFQHILSNDTEKIYEIKDYVIERLENILQKDNLEDVREKRDLILEVFQEQFWENLTFEDVEFMIKELAYLMVYYETNPKKIIQIDAPDLILNVGKFEKEVKEDEKFKEFVNKNPLVKKIKNGEGITPNELLKLEEQIKAIRPEITIDNIQRIRKIDFILFLRKIIGLTEEYDPKVLIEREFDSYILGKNQHYNSQQIEFLQLLKKVFADRKRIALEDFAKDPLKEERPLEKFQISELKAIVAKCNKIKIK